MKISKTFHFDAAHRLTQVDPSHQCFRLHGHTYKVEIVCSGPIDERGFICDFSEIADAWAPVAKQLDHRFLNDIPGLENPTCETLVLWIANRLEGINVCAVRLHESSTTWCEVDLPWGKK